MTPIFTQKKSVYDIIDSLGYIIIYLSDYDMYIALESSSSHNPSNHIYGTTLTGKDITEMFNHFGSNFQDVQTVQTAISKIKTRTYQFDQSLKYVYVK